MSKAYYRAFLIEIKPFVKLNTFCKMVGLSPSTLSLFMRSPDNSYMISADRLAALCELISSTMRNFA